MEENNEFKKLKGKNKILLLVLLLCLICVAVLAVLLFVKDSKKSNDNGNDNNETKNEVKEVKLSNVEKKELLSYIPRVYSGWYEQDDYYSGFQDKKVTPSDLRIDTLIYIVMEKMDKSKRQECIPIEDNKLNGLCDFVFNVSDIKDSLKSMYGDFEYDLPAEINMFALYHCTLSNDRYVCSNSGGGNTYSLLNTYLNYFGLMGDNGLYEITKVEEDKENIYIYLDYVKVKFDIKSELLEKEVLDLNDVRFNLYKYGVGNKMMVNDTLKGEDFYNFDLTFKDVLFDKYSDKLTQYKITYKKNDSGYSLVSIEPLN